MKGCRPAAGGRRPAADGQPLPHGDKAYGHLYSLHIKVVKWQLPGDGAFVDELPHAVAGKLRKSRLREPYRNCRLPGG